MVVLVCCACGRRRVPDSGSHQPAPPAAEGNLKLSLASPDPDEPVAISRIEAQRSYAEISQQYLDALVRHRRSMFRLNTVVGSRVFP